jgi:hypothetical protein
MAYASGGAERDGACNSCLFYRSWSCGFRWGIDLRPDVACLNITMMIDRAHCRREDTRVTVNRPSTIRTSDTRPRDVTVEDLSQAGFSFSSSSPVPAGTIIHVGLAGAGRTCAEVTWRQGDRYGCRFRSPLSAAQRQEAFRQPLEASIAWLEPLSSAANPGAATPNLKLSPYLRLASISGAGLLGWGAIATWLRTLPPF